MTTPSTTEPPRLQVKPHPVGLKAFDADPINVLAGRIGNAVRKLVDNPTRENEAELKALNGEINALNIEALDALDGGGKGACRT